MLVEERERGIASTESATASNVDVNWEVFRHVAGAVALDGGTPGIWLLDARGRTTQVSRCIAELLGYTSNEMIGRDLHAFAKGGFESEGGPATSLDRARIPGPQEVPLTRKDGTLVWALLLFSPIFDRHGQYVGALGTLCDLTAQKQREEALRGRVAEVDSGAGSPSVTAHVPKPSVAVPRGAATSTELIRGAVVLGACATFVATVALLTGWGVVSSLVQGNDKRERPSDWDFDP